MSKDYEVTVLRISTKSLTLRVKADSQAEADHLALDSAGDHDFTTEGREINATYELS